MYNLSSIYKSLIIQVNKVITDAISNGQSSNLKYYAWDSRGETVELPSVDLLGLSNWTFRENHGLWEIRAGLTLSTYNDKNLFRQIDIVDTIHNYFGEETQVPLIDATTGEVFSNLVVSDFDMMPTGQSERRNYLPVGIELLRTESGN